MPTTIRREARACPVCSLPITVLHTSDGKTIEYDITEWARLCRHPGAGSPLTCPGLEAQVRRWIGER